MAMSPESARNSTDRINIINIALMLLSALLAYAWPFYLFLVAYAVLGPLHYLTEISWLHDHQYYTSRKSDALFLLVIGVLYGAMVVLGYSALKIIPNMILLALVGSFILVFTANWFARIALIVAGSALVFIVPMSLSTLIVAMMLLTIFHVFVFTGCFILIGSMRSHSRSGYISFSVFVAVALFLLLFRSLPSGGVADSFVVQHYGRGFGDVNVVLLRAFNASPLGVTASDPFEFSAGAVAIMRFIAFAYLYHYLNWFSKTKIIRWHEVSKLRMGLVLSLWIAAVIFYFIDYDLGLRVLFTLSALHVLLEFPLDVRTMLGIVTHFGKRVKSVGVRLEPAQ